MLRKSFPYYSQLPANQYTDNHNSQLFLILNNLSYCHSIILLQRIKIPANLTLLKSYIKKFLLNKVRI